MEPSQVQWYWIFGFWWIVALVATVAKLVWWHLTTPETESEFSLWGRIAYQFSFYTCWALLTPLIFRFGEWLLGRRNRFLRVGSVVMAATGAVFTMGFVRSSLHNLEHAKPWTHGLSWIARDSIGRLHEDLMIFVAVLAVGLARRYYQQRESQHSTAALLRAELTEAKLRALQMQLNPHFLFNALNSISALVEDDPQRTRIVVARLSDLLRRSLDVTEQEVTLWEEVEFTKSYLDIMKIRFGDKLSIRIDIDSKLHDALVPAFILQPLVENAFEHGLSCFEGTGEITIRAARDGEVLKMSVQDNGPGPDIESPNKGRGIGLKNIEARLQVLYPLAYALRLTQGGSRGALMEVEVPHRSSQRGRAV